MTNAAESMDAVREILDDKRLLALRDWFLPSGGLPKVVAHARARLDAMADADRIQSTKIIDRWTGLLATESKADPASVPGAARDIRAWDFRVGSERDAIPRDDQFLPDEVREIVNELAHDWGMAEPDRPTGHFDAIVIIGGLARANIGRPASVARWMQIGLQADAVIGLASARETSERERLIAESHRMPSATEQEALRFGLEVAFELDPRAWEARQAEILVNDTSSVPISLVVAPPDESGRRANTTEGLKWLIQRRGLPSGSEVLQVTTPIYWIANQIAARTTIPPPVRVRTTGYDMAIEGWEPLLFAAQHYLQELKSAIDALPSLVKWVEATTADDTGGTRT